MKLPKALKKGDTIGIIAPSGSTKDEKAVDKGAKIIESLGFKTVIGKSCREPRYGYLADKDKERALDVNNFFADNSIDGIVCMKGGYGTPRILDMLDYETIKANPKVFVGYSDITGLHLAFQQKVGFPSFHAPMVNGFASQIDDYTKASWLRCLTSNTALGIIKNPTDEEVAASGTKNYLGSFLTKKFNGGKACGVITGGNLSLVAALAGTEYAIKPDGAIIFLEDVSEEPYRIDRMLTQLRLCGVFDRCNGIVLGYQTHCTASDPTRSLTIEQIINDILVPCGKPIVSFFASGHSIPTISFPIGVNVEIDADNKTVNFLESALS